MDMMGAVKHFGKVKKFSFEDLDNAVIEEIKNYFFEAYALDEDIKTDFEIVDNRRTKKVKDGLLSVSAPYYMIFYSQKTPGAYRNTGFKIRRMALYMYMKGLLSDLKYKVKLSPELKKKGNLEACAVMGFGKGTEAQSGKEPMTSIQLSVYKEKPKSWINIVIDAVRHAPSYKNGQPWRFLICRNEFHVFYKGRSAKDMSGYEEMDIGGLLANIYTASDELWLDLKIVKKEDVSYKTMNYERYITSIVPNDEFGI